MTNIGLRWWSPIATHYKLLHQWPSYIYCCYLVYISHQHTVWICLRELLVISCVHMFVSIYIIYSNICSKDYVSTYSACQLGFIPAMASHSLWAHFHLFAFISLDICQSLPAILTIFTCHTVIVLNACITSLYICSLQCEVHSMLMIWFP